MRTVSKEASTRQLEILGYIRDYIDENGYGPSLREIASHVGIYISAVAKHVKKLKANGYLVDHDRTIARLLIITDKGHSALNE